MRVNLTNSQLKSAVDQGPRKSRIQNRLSQRKHRGHPNASIGKSKQDGRLIFELEAGQKIRQRTQTSGENLEAACENDYQESFDAPDHNLNYPNSLWITSVDPSPIIGPQDIQPIDLDLPSTATMQYSLTEDELASCENEHFWLPDDPMGTMPVSVANEGQSLRLTSTTPKCTCNFMTAAGGFPDTSHMALEADTGSPPPPFCHRDRNSITSHSDFPIPSPSPRVRFSQYKAVISRYILSLRLTCSVNTWSLCSSSHQPSLANPQANFTSSHSTSCAKSLPTPTMAPVIPKRASQFQISGHLPPSQDLLRPGSAKITPPDTSPGGHDLAMESGPSQVDITSRLSIVLDAVQKAGFQDFEAMVEAYYTANLDRNSFPALLQCASRRRRLKPMLHNLQDSSRQWPRWESRGFNESISAGTGEFFGFLCENFCSSSC